MQAGASTAEGAASHGSMAAGEAHVARRVDESSARVALSVLERAGFLQRHPDVPRTPTVRLFAANGDIPQALHAFISAAHLRPQQFQTLDLVALAAALRLSPAALEEYLLAWRDAHLLEYRDGVRDLLIELCPPPADGKTRLPELLDALAARRERQLDALLAYAESTECRQVVIARYCGERLSVPACGVCDRCRPDTATSASLSLGRRLRSPRVRDAAVVRATILECLGGLSYSVGITGLMRILRGDVDVAPGGARSQQYGALAGVGTSRLRREIEALIEQGILERDAAGEYPLLRLRSGTS